MQKVYYKDKLILETDCKDKIKELVDQHIAKAKAQMKPHLDKIKLLENMVLDLYPKRPKDTIEEYVDFLRKVNPEFIKTMEALGKAAFGERYSGLYILAPNTVGALFVYLADEGYKDKVSIAVLRERLKGQIPSWRHIHIEEEK